MSDDTYLSEDDERLVKAAEAGTELTPKEIMRLGALVRELDREIGSLEWAVYTGQQRDGYGH